jgi:CRISPR-associated endonuclease/helicase Cas3
VLRDTCGLEVFPSDPSRFADLHRQSTAPRYRIRWVDQDEGRTMAGDAVRAGKKVLWVVNTVARCQAVARRLTAELSGAGDVLVYHSRFRLTDRRRRHEEAIALFRDQGRPAVLVSTQVCEMSLDLDADVLVTEVAPVPALIQRMGRCCREPTPRPGRLGEVYVYPPPDVLPYTRPEIDQGRAFARTLAGLEVVGHADLSAYLAAMSVPDPFAEGGFTGFLDSGWYAMARDDSFREDNDFTIDCVLDVDRDAYVRERRAGTGVAPGYIVPIPRRFATSDPVLPSHVGLARSDHYDARYGFLDEVIGNA